MHYNFLFNGCSWTYGSELEGFNKDKEYQRTHRFSHLVAENLRMTYDNISKSGISNDWIVEKTIEWFNAGNTCDLAIIQFTLVDRTIFYDEDDKNKEYAFSPVLSINGRKFYPEYISLKCSLYYKTFYSNFLGYQNFYKNVFILENFFKMKNINFIFMSILRERKNKHQCNWRTFCNTEDIKNMKELVGFKNNNEYDLLRDGHAIIYNENYCKDLSKKNNTLCGGHPSELGHQKIAYYIIGEIDKNAYIL